MGPNIAVFSYFIMVLHKSAYVLYVSLSAFLLGCFCPESWPITGPTNESIQNGKTTNNMQKHRKHYKTYCKTTSNNNKHTTKTSKTLQTTLKTTATRYKQLQHHIQQTDFASQPDPPKSSPKQIVKFLIVNPLLQSVCCVPPYRFPPIMRSPHAKPHRGKVSVLPNRTIVVNGTVARAPGGSWYTANSPQAERTKTNKKQINGQTRQTR